MTKIKSSVVIDTVPSRQKARTWALTLEREILDFKHFKSMMSAELRFSALIFKLSLKVISTASLVRPVYFLLYAFWGFSFPALAMNSLHPRIKKVNHFHVFHLTYRLQLTLFGCVFRSYWYKLLT